LRNSQANLLVTPTARNCPLRFVGQDEQPMKEQRSAMTKSSPPLLTFPKKLATWTLRRLVVSSLNWYQSWNQSQSAQSSPKKLANWNSHSQSRSQKFWKPDGAKTRLQLTTTTLTKKDPTHPLWLLQEQPTSRVSMNLP
jgi:hypothetical protein